jgi:hypothetical protein
MFLTDRRRLRSACIRTAALTMLAAALAPSCGARTGLEAGPPAPPEPECYRDDDCEGSGDACYPVVCVLDIEPIRPGADPAGHCVAAEPVDCDDNDPCTNDLCDPLTAQCSYSIATFDLDGDGFRGPILGKKAGEPDSCGDDCNDANEDAYPGGIEVCDGVDNDCNDVIDDNATFVPEGVEPIRISTTDFGYADPAGIAYSGESYVAVYTSGQGQRVFTTGLTPEGDKIPPGDVKLTDVDADSFGGPLVWIGDRYGVVFQDRRFDNYEIFFTLLNDKGEKVIADVRLSSAFGFSLYPSIGWNGTEFIVVWQDERDGDNFYNVYAQRVSVDGVPIGGNVALTDDVDGYGNEAPWVAVGDTSIAVVWGIGDSSFRWVRFQTFTNELEPIMPEPISLTDGQSNPRGQFVAWNEDNYVVAWHEESGETRSIYAAVVEQNGTVSSQPTAISAPAAGGQSRFPHLKALGDRVLALYQDNRDTGKYELYARMVDENLQPITGEQRITFTPNDSTGPIAAFGPDGSIGVLFQDYDSATSPAEQQVFFTRLGCVAGTTP